MQSMGDYALQPPPFGGPWDSRPKLTGDWCCLRENLRDNGYTFDISTTEYYQGIASGGLQETFRFGGRNDYLVNVDGQKAGLWQGLGINLHGETVYGDSVNLVTGAIVPVNIGRAHPVFFGDRDRSDRCQVHAGAYRKTSSCTPGRSTRSTTSSNRSCAAADSMPAS